MVHFEGKEGRDAHSTSLLESRGWRKSSTQSTLYTANFHDRFMDIHLQFIVVVGTQQHGLFVRSLYHQYIMPEYQLSML